MNELVRVNLEHDNGKRTTVTLHPFSGIHTPFRAGDLVETLSRHLHALRCQDGDHILGLDGPGMVPATLLSLVTTLPTVFATKQNLALSPKIEFEEPLSPEERRKIFIYGLRRSMRVILVDDGITTGQTMRSCLNALRTAGIGVRGIVTIVESRNHDLRDELDDRCPLIGLFKLPPDFEEEE